MARQYGLIGFPLSHSFSGKYFAEKFAAEGITDCRYELFPIEHAAQLPGLVARNAELLGLNVTIPHKETIMQLLHETDETAALIGAVNCIKIWRNPDGTALLKGFNTDYIGFKESLEPLLQAHHHSALVLGSGGASKAVKYALTHLGIEYKSVSRSGDNSCLRYEDIDAGVLEHYGIIINTTPLGTYPDESSSPPIPYHLLSSKHLLYDLVYNPAETVFLAKGKAQGTTIKNGLEMLVIQAEESWKIWQA